MTSVGSLATKRPACALSRAATVSHSSGAMMIEPLFSSIASISAEATDSVKTWPGSMATAGRAAAGGSAVGAGVAATGAAVPAVLRDPGEAFTQSVAQALIDAMLENSGSLIIAPNEWLTVAARDNQDVVMPGAAPDVVTIILRVKGSDLAERLSGRLPTDELRRRVEVREF